MPGYPLMFNEPLALPGYYIEPGADTPSALRDAIERQRAATVLPIPFRRLRRRGPWWESRAEFRERLLQIAAWNWQQRADGRLQVGDRPEDAPEELP